jgi:hypothetical protein
MPLIITGYNIAELAFEMPQSHVRDPTIAAVVSVDMRRAMVVHKDFFQYFD